MANRRTSRPTYQWSNFGDVENNQDLSTATSRFGSSGSAVNTAQTLIRVRGKVGVTLDAAAVNERAMILCGLIAVNGDAFAAGDTAAPEIFTNSDDEASWIWQGALYVDAGSEAAVNENRLSDSIEVDSKAMRKLKPGQVITLVIHTPAELVSDQTGLFDLVYFFHCLNQL